MRIVAIETSGRSGSLALLEQEQLLRETNLAGDRRTAQTLAPALDGLLKDADWEPNSVELVAVANGPGSFTGLRIAVTTAKVLAYATGAQLVALNTLHVLAEQLPAEADDAWLVMNAQRGQLFAARYRRDNDAAWREMEPCHIVDRTALPGRLSAGTWISGPAVQQLDLGACPAHRLAPEEAWTPHARTVGLLGCRALMQGLTIDPFRLQPQYYRPSYAEEKPS